MRTMKTLLGLLAAIVVLGGSLTAFAQSTSSTTTGTVHIVEGGTFSVSLCTSASFKVGGSAGSNPVVTSATGARTQASVAICYVDTQSYRGEFTASMSATDFVATTPGVNATIPSENLYLNRVIRPRHAGQIIHSPDAGLIYSIGSSREIGPATNQDGSSVPWTPLTYDLSVPRVVGRGEAGIGISNNGAAVRPAVYLDLVIPPGQRPATYKTVITLTVTPENP